jgi:hypothetical protein
MGERQGMHLGVARERHGKQHQQWGEEKDHK